MLSQRSKFNFIIIVSLCIVNILMTESFFHSLPMTVDHKGDITVDFDGVKFTLDFDFTLTVNDGDCIYKVDLTLPEGDELASKQGTRNGSVHCKSWSISRPRNQS
uniref:Uncharacterized protein n=1 Tax=Trichobilharzia regenti TaxID=157069 RepID=A0AA85KKI7_TRIRE|nr:unnamed protein product [Trichobilharzia regenti]